VQGTFAKASFPVCTLAGGMGSCKSKKEVPPPKDYYEAAGRERIVGTELMCARDQIQMDIFKETFWCFYLRFFGCGCLGPLDKGCILNIGEICCCAGTCKSATCCDEDGCFALTTKCWCALTHTECPPSNTPGIGCGPFLMAGNLDRSDAKDLSPTEQEELYLLQSTCWCCFLYCCGVGCNSPGGSDPCCKLEGKLCFVWCNTETGSCCEDGWIEYTGKCCCCVFDCSIPAGKTPGIGCCNMLHGGNLTDDGSDADSLKGAWWQSTFSKQ